MMEYQIIVACCIRDPVRIPTSGANDVSNDTDERLFNSYIGCYDNKMTMLSGLMSTVKCCEISIACEQNIKNSAWYLLGNI